MSFLYTIVGRVLLSFYAISKSYGFSIVLFGLLVCLLLIPLTKRSVISKLVGELLLPQVNAIKEKYENDKAQINKNLFDLYIKYEYEVFSDAWPLIIVAVLMLGLSGAATVFKGELRGYSTEMFSQKFYWIENLSSSLRDVFATYWLDDSQFYLALILPIALLVIMLLRILLLQSISHSTEENRLEIAAAFIIPALVSYYLPAAVVLFYAVFCLGNIIVTLIVKLLYIDKRGRDLDKYSKAPKVEIVSH